MNERQKERRATYAAQNPSSPFDSEPYAQWEAGEDCIGELIETMRIAMTKPVWKVALKALVYFVFRRPKHRLWFVVWRATQRSRLRWVNGVLRDENAALRR